MTFLIILNPAANRGRAAHTRAAITSAFRAHELPFELIFTEHKGHAQQLAANAAATDRYGAVVAAGGDGTINEIVNGLLGSTLPLGFVPLGTGNDWVKLWNLPPDQPQIAAERLRNAAVRTVDVGCVNGRAFLNGVGCGFDAQIAIEAAQIRRLKGLAVYGAALLRALARYRAPRMRVAWHGNVLGKRLLLAAVGNGRCQGGSFWLTPTAQVNDGLLDLCLVDALRLDEIARHIGKVLRGTHTQLQQVHMARASSVTITSPDPLPVHADGEVLGAALHEIEIKLKPAALRILV
jgi:YegS/Rv2252/BmrU family lipid kinase